MRYLDKINSPRDLKRLQMPQLPVVAEEIREFLVNSVSKTGGHLASNLGVVELTLALHYCLNSPDDKILWDVGHQSYPHKILTGRRDEFDTLRQFGGLSGFTKSTESPHDVFDVGHSSTSLSAAHGLAISRDLLGQRNKVVAVIGDGSLTSGLALEGLNNIGRSDTDLTVILNDNQMSISENVGALSRYLNDLRSAPSYINVKGAVRGFLQNIPIVGKGTGSFLEKTKTHLKYLLIPGVLFQELGFKYYGPVDGHNLEQLVGVMQNVKEIKGPVLVHVRTKKGMGYVPAERQPAKFHGIGPFDAATGAVKPAAKATYTDVFANKIVELGQANDKIVAITASMPTGCGLASFKKNFPHRFFDVGIAEGHAVTFAAGLAKGGLRPVVAIYSTFLQRAYDQILHDVCIQKLPVVFMLDRAGVVPGDGETHQGIFDLSYLTHMPNLTVLAPANAAEFGAMLDFAMHHNGPVAIRYPKDTASSFISSNPSPIRLGESETLVNGEKIAIIAVGSMVDAANLVCERLCADGYAPTLINPRFIKPLDIGMVTDLAKYSHIFTIEENVHAGGFGQSLHAALRNKGITTPRLHPFAIDDDFPPIGTRDELLALVGLDADSIYTKIAESVSHDEAI
ncbi:MAG: 1-deoxy-D-xylulose-5-phosphate synthase [Defluviitaleaceae bacterium]|nr:1-deoxy-D-xylulose-5-phosphate synthase [Defluviitaleaceae bacterium]